MSAFESNESQSIYLINNDLKVTLETDNESYTIGEPIEVTIFVTNTGEEDITAEFPDTQKADFWVDWGDVYLWSADKYFAQVLTPVEIPSGETVELFSKNWEQVDYGGNQVPDGEYEIEGWMVESSYNYYPIFSNSVTISIGNHPPEAPTIRGKWLIREPGPYDYKFKAKDPDGDDVKYFIDWGDGHFEWTDYNASGEEVIVTHTWNHIGTALVVAYAEDIHGAKGPEGYLEHRSKEDCDCQTTVSDVYLNRLDTISKIKDSFDGINKLMGANEYWDICFIIIIRLGILLVRIGILIEIRDSFNPNGYLYSIIESRLQSLGQIRDLLMYLNLKYDCGVPVP
jgi:hypothetical protein